MTLNTSSPQPSNNSIMQERVRTARPPRTGSLRRRSTEPAPQAQPQVVGDIVNVEIVSAPSAVHDGVVSIVVSPSSFHDTVTTTIVKQAPPLQPTFNPIMTDETEELLREFEDLWDNTYPELGEAVDQCEAANAAKLIENTISISAEEELLEHLNEVTELIGEVSGDYITSVQLLDGHAPSSEDLVFAPQHMDSEPEAIAFAPDDAESASEEIALALEDMEPAPSSAVQSFAVPIGEGGHSDLRLGQLLVELKIITSEILDEAVHMAVEMSMSVGRALIMSGFLTSAQLQWAVQLQALLRDNLITMTVAAQVADLMSCPGMTMQRALNCAGQPYALRMMETRATRFGDLLIDSDLIEETEFSEALVKAQALGLPIGRYLLISGYMTAPLLETVANAQRLIRDGKIERADAVVAIKQAARRQYELRKNSKTVDYGRVPLRTMRIGELLILSGIITETHLEYAIEFGLRCNVAIGQVLLDFEILSKETLENALTLQALVANGSMEPLDAAYTLIDVHHRGYSLDKALKRNRELNTERKSLSFEQFIASIELLSIEQIGQSLETARRSPLFVSKALVFSGAMSEEAAQIALMCHFYIQENLLTNDQALLLFNLCHRTGLSVEEGLTELGMTMGNRAVSAEL